MSTETATALVGLSGACRYYHAGEDNEVRAVDRVNLQVGRGRFITLRGRSGSGKTTLLNLVGGLDQVTAGEVYFDGQALSGLSDNQLTELRRHEMGFVFQTFSLLPVLSAYENVELTMRIAGMAAGERRVRARELLTLVGLRSRMHHRPFELSGGEQQRVAVARALANRPTLLIADEPTGALDSVTGIEIVLLFRRVVDEQGVTVIMATHDPALSQFTDDTWLMEDGRLDHAEGPLDIDLPDLVQHMEFGEPLLDVGKSQHDAEEHLGIVPADAGPAGDAQFQRPDSQ